MHLNGICILVCADKYSPGQWPKESEAKLGQLVLQAGTDQSALSQQLFLSLSTLPFLCTHTHIHPHTDRQALAVCSLSRALMAFVRQPCWRRQAWHTIPPWHVGFVISLFRRGFGVILPPLRGKWIQAFFSRETLMPWGIFLKNLLWRIWIPMFNGMQGSNPAWDQVGQNVFSGLVCFFFCMKWKMMDWLGCTNSINKKIKHHKW